MMHRECSTRQHDHSAGRGRCHGGKEAPVGQRQDLNLLATSFPQHPPARGTMLWTSLWTDQRGEAYFKELWHMGTI